MAVVALEGAEILQMQIAADEHARRAKQGVRTRQKIEKKRMGAAKERERILRQELELHRQALEIPTGILRQNRPHYFAGASHAAPCYPRSEVLPHHDAAAAPRLDQKIPDTARTLFSYASIT
jgi:hypothetical protein